MVTNDNSCESGLSQNLAAGQNSIDLAVLDEVRELAEIQGCAQNEMILSLLRQALHTRRRQDQTHRAWESLSQREKQVAALVCTGMTGRQIAARLVLSPETIKTHVRHILAKFGLNSRQNFRNLLSGWDFSRWLMVDSALMIAEPSVFHKKIGHELYDPSGDEYEYGQ